MVAAGQGHTEIVFALVYHSDVDLNMQNKVRLSQANNHSLAHCCAIGHQGNSSYHFFLSLFIALWLCKVMYVLFIYAMSSSPRAGGRR